MAQSLLHFLRQVPDFRRKEGKRFQLDAILAMVIMGIMSGRYGYRELGRFVQANQDALIKHLGLNRDYVPSHVTLYTVLRNIDFAALVEAFTAWARQHVSISAGDVLAIDGKALGSTVEQYSTAYQNFICIVSLYSQRQGAVARVARYQNGHRSEIPTVVDLIKALDLTDVTFSLDALHCQKKH